MNSTENIQIVMGMIGNNNVPLRIQNINGTQLVMFASKILISTNVENVNYLEKFFNDIEKQFPNSQYDISFKLDDNYTKMGTLEFNPMCEGLFEELIDFCDKQENIKACPDYLWSTDLENTTDLDHTSILNGPKKGMFYNCLNFIFTCSCRTKK
jgi:hypothetical protein